MDLTSLLHARPEDVARDDSPLLRAYWRVADRWHGTVAERAAILQAVAQADEPEALDDLDALAEIAGWTPSWQHGDDRTVCHRRLNGHRVGVCCLAFGTVGGRTTLASGDHRGEVRLWDARTGTLLLAFSAHETSMTALAFCPDLLGLSASSQAPLITGGSDGKVRCWAPDTGALLGEFDVHGDPRAFVSVRGAIAVGWANGLLGGVALWTLDTGEVRANVFPKMGGVKGLVAIGDALAAADGSHIDIRDARTFAPIAMIENRVWHQAFVSPLGKVTLDDAPAIVWVVDDGLRDMGEPDWCEQGFAWASASGELLGEQNLHMYRERALAVGDFPKPLLATTRERDVHVTWHDELWLRGHSSTVEAAAFGEIDGVPVLATADEGFYHEGQHHDGTVILWDLPRRHSDGYGFRACGLSVVTDSPRPIIVMGSEYETYVADAVTGEPVSSIHCGDGISEDERFCGVAVAAAMVGKEPLVATGGTAQGIKLWRLTGVQSGVLEFETCVPVLAFGSIDGRVVLAAGGPGELAAVYDPTTKERLAELYESPNVAAWNTKAIALGSVDGQPVIAVGGWRIELWSAEGRRLHCFAGDGDVLALGKIAGRTVLAGSSGLEARVWDAGTCEQIATLPHPVPITCATMVGHLLVTGDESGTVHLWDARTERRLSTLGVFAQSVRAVAAATIGDSIHVYSQSRRRRVTACQLGPVVGNDGKVPPWASTTSVRE